MLLPCDGEGVDLWLGRLYAFVVLVGCRTGDLDVFGQRCFDDERLLHEVKVTTWFPVVLGVWCWCSVACRLVAAVV